jgi:hypothetical protein
MIARLIGVLFFILAVLALPFAQAGDVHVVVRPEVSGTEMVYHYELINHGTSRMKNFSIGSELVEPNVPDGPSRGTLTRLPTNTIWGPAPAMSLLYPKFPDPRAGWQIPIPSPTSVLSPPQWRAEISGALRTRSGTKSPESIARERYAIDWYAPFPVYKGPIDITGADTGQRLTGFSVRVPQDSATGPGSVGSLTNYTQGEWDAELWYGPTVLEETEERRRGRIVESPSMEITFTTTPNIAQTVAPGSLVSVKANIEPLVYGDPSPVIRLESIACRGDCVLNKGVTGAVFGTDDREFQLLAPSEGSRTPSQGFWSRSYDITYSVMSSIIVSNPWCPPPGQVYPPGYIPPPVPQECLRVNTNPSRTVTTTITIKSPANLATPLPGRRPWTFPGR